MTKIIDMEAGVEIEIPFYDIDSANIAWHGNYVKYFEVARCVLLDKLNYNYVDMTESGFFWPVVDISIRYINPARFKQKIWVNAKLVEWENRLKINYLITDIKTGSRLTKGYSVQVAVKISSGEMLLASPPILYERLGLKRL
jgi:acyl-CoA thioester hydrolase